MAEPIFCLSVIQPWPWAIFRAGKDCENRGWHPSKSAIGKRIAIHASKSTVELRDVDTRNFIADVAGKLWRPEEIVLGAVVGTVLLTGYVEESDSPWFVGRWGLQLADPFELPKPIARKGSLGLWKLPEEVAAQVRAQEAARAA